MDYQAFLQAAGRGRPPALALIHGADCQLLDDALAATTRSLFPDPTHVALGREVLEGAETPAEAVVRAASTLPFMTAMRLVVVRRAQLLSPKGSDALTEHRTGRSEKHQSHAELTTPSSGCRWEETHLASQRRSRGP